MIQPKEMNALLLNAQSPSERWDSDCALSQETLGRFDPIVGRMTPQV
jgi:hypothetical protein